MAAALFDAQGCLSRRASPASRPLPPAPVPAELAAHLACCRRCQRRLLATAMGRLRDRRGARVRRCGGPEWSVVVCLLLVMIAMMLMQILNPPAR